MSTGQTMLTAGFFVLLIMSVISANRMMVESSQSNLEGDALNLAVDATRAVINEAQRKKFDDLLVDTLYQDPTKFTTPAALGPSSLEVITPWPDQAPFLSATTYNDFDDYNGYIRMLDIGAITGFKITCQVYYVDPKASFAKANVQTDFKRIDVNIEHPQYLKKITFSTIVTH